MFWYASYKTFVHGLSSLWGLVSSKSSTFQEGYGAPPTMVMRILLLAFFLSALSSAEAQIINATSCSANDVQTAFNSITSSTTTVEIPACPGGVAWTTGVTLNVPAGSTTLTVIGAGNQGVVGGGDQTVILDNVSHSSSDNATLTIATVAGSTFRLSGITLESNGDSSVSYNGSIRISGNSGSVRIDHSHLGLTDDAKQMSVYGCVYGVMDHSIVDLQAGTTNNGVFLDQGSCAGDSSGVGNGQWNTATNLGSAAFFYFENDTFNGGTNGSSNIAPFADDCSGGGRFVFRYNTLNGVVIQGHGTGHANDPPDRGCRAYEIYNNTFTGGSTSAPITTGFYNTSGTGVIWGNNVTGYYQTFISGHVNRASNSTYTQTAPPNGWGYCGTTQTGSASAWDQNTNSSGYACLDQIGRGKGDLLQGSFPEVCDASSTDCSNHIYTGRWSNQALEPVYEWQDAWTVPPDWPGAIWSETDAQAVQNRDYYLGCNSSGQTGCTTFTGATGVGSGSMASAPSSCTTGTAYWASDQGSWNQSGSGGQGELFVCNAGKFAEFYTPYQYPHPLTSSGGVAASAPAAPVSLKATVQ